MPLGFSYAPGSDIQMNGPSNGSGSAGRGLSPQQAVKILSLRVPEQVPQNAPISRGLMTSPGGMAAGAGGLQSMIQQLIRGMNPQQAGGMQGTAQPAIPNQMAPKVGPGAGGQAPPSPFGQMPIGAGLGAPPSVQSPMMGAGPMPTPGTPAPPSMGGSSYAPRFTPGKDFDSGPFPMPIDFGGWGMDDQSHFSNPDPAAWWTQFIEAPRNR